MKTTVSGYLCNACGKSLVNLPPNISSNDDGTYSCECGGELQPSTVYPPETEDAGGMIYKN